MAAKRQMAIHFNDGTRLVLDFPRQVQHDIELPGKIQKMLESRVLAFEVDGDFLAVPVDSIKYIQSHPAPEKLPDTVIKGARMRHDL